MNGIKNDKKKDLRELKDIVNEENRWFKEQRKHSEQQRKKPLDSYGMFAEKVYEVDIGQQIIYNDTIHYHEDEESTEDNHKQGEEEPSDMLDPVSDHALYKNFLRVVIH